MSGRGGYGAARRGGWAPPVYSGFVRKGGAGSVAPWRGSFGGRGRGRGGFGGRGGGRGRGRGRDKTANLSVEDLDKELDAYRRSKDPAKALDADMDDYWKARDAAKAAAASGGDAAKAKGDADGAKPAVVAAAATSAPAPTNVTADAEKLKLAD